jgi:DNA mismatch repair protein MutL
VVKDRQLQGVLRAAYHDVMPPRRHAVAPLNLQLPLEAVDVNVAPAKTEVRFADADAVRRLDHPSACGRRLPRGRRGGGHGGQRYSGNAGGMAAAGLWHGCG